MHAHAHEAASSGAPGWVAVVALIISAALLAWNVASYVVKVPRVHVFIRSHVKVKDDGQGGFQPSEYRYEVIAINAGSEPVTIWDVGINGSPHNVGEAGVGNTALFLTLSNHDDLWSGPELPARLEGHGALSWWFEDGASLDGARSGDTIHGVVERFRPVPLWKTWVAKIAARLQGKLGRPSKLPRVSNWLAGFGMLAISEQVRKISREGIERI